MCGPFFCAMTTSQLQAISIATQRGDFPLAVAFRSEARLTALRPVFFAAGPQPIVARKAAA